MRTEEKGLEPVEIVAFKLHYQFDNIAEDDSLDWHDVYFGTVKKQAVLKFVKDERWQTVRKWMKGKTLTQKHRALSWWLSYNQYNIASKVQATNYVTALSRGGLIKPADYNYYGIYNVAVRQFQFNDIRARSSKEAMAQLYERIGKDSWNWRFTTKHITFSETLKNGKKGF